MENTIKTTIEESVRVKQAILEDPYIIDRISYAAKKMISSLSNGGKIILCGNGGSASDALHFAGEIVGRFQKERGAWPAIVLNSNPVVVSAIANDYTYADVFSRQVQAFADEKDVLVGISTSGNSENVAKAIEAAKGMGALSIALLGCGGGKIKGMADLALVVPSDVTARVQESHILIIHILCELIEEALSKG